MTPCPTCDRPPADESRPATLGPGESCGCGLRWPGGTDTPAIAFGPSGGAFGQPTTGRVVAPSRSGQTADAAGDAEAT